MKANSACALMEMGSDHNCRATRLEGSKDCYRAMCPQIQTLVLCWEQSPLHVRATASRTCTTDTPCASKCIGIKTLTHNVNPLSPRHTHPERTAKTLNKAR